MFRATRLTLLVFVLATAFAATAQAHMMKTTHATEVQTLRLTIQHETNTVQFFTSGKGHWMLHVNHAKCADVAGAPKALCVRSRAILMVHKQLLAQLQANLTKLLPPPAPALPWAFWNCVASGWSGGAPGVGSYESVGEGGATSVDPSGTYYGRYQMDWGFMEHWGSDMLAKYHGASAAGWSVLDQTIVAERGFGGQGAGAWPNTAPPCLFLRR